MEALIENFFNLDVMYRSRMLLWAGVKVTLKISVLSLLFAISLGMLLAIIRSIGIKIVNALIIIYVDVFRAIPVIVFLILVYFTGPYFGLELSPYWAAVLTFTINGSAFFEEIFRAGIESIDRGQTDAAKSIGLNFGQTMRYVILPQAVQVVLPPATSNSLELIKTTVLASVIALPELMKQAQQAHGYFANPTPLVAAAIIFLVILWPLVRLTEFLEKKYGKIV
ncbi:MAG: amino acid ABC transporter permease [Spirochaetaceae bacterium]